MFRALRQRRRLRKLAKGDVATMSLEERAELEALRATRVDSFARGYEFSGYLPHADDDRGH